MQTEKKQITEIFFHIFVYLYLIFLPFLIRKDWYERVSIVDDFLVS